MAITRCEGVVARQTAILPNEEPKACRFRRMRTAQDRLSRFAAMTSRANHQLPKANKRPVNRAIGDNDVGRAAIAG